MAALHFATRVFLAENHVSEVKSRKEHERRGDEIWQAKEFLNPIISKMDKHVVVIII